MTGTRAAAQTEKVLFGFNGDNEFEPGNLRAGLIFDSAGNLYGTTSSGGTEVYGTVFELSPGVGGTWKETTLYNFGSYDGDGLTPQAGLVFDVSSETQDKSGQAPEAERSVCETAEERVIYIIPNGFENHGHYSFY
jgi:hypothetical protein